MGNELADQMIAVKAQLLVELESGGTLTELPCPFCGLPRCLRTDYIRCQKCGVNWWEGTDLTRNPHIKANPARTGSLMVIVESGTVALSRIMDQKSAMSAEPDYEDDPSNPAA